MSSVYHHHRTLPHPTHHLFEENVGKAHAFLAGIRTRQRQLLPPLNDLVRVHELLFENTAEEEGYLKAIPGKLKIEKTCIRVPGGFLHHSLPSEVEKDYAELLVEMEELGLELGCLHLSPSDDHVKAAKLRFVCAYHSRLLHIHPFEDGNGRFSRCISWFQLLALFGDELEKFPRISFETSDALAGDVDPLDTRINYHTKFHYISGMDAAHENLFYLARYFNVFFPELVLPARIPPPKGKVRNLQPNPP